MPKKKTLKAPPAPRSSESMNVYQNKQKEWDQTFVQNARKVAPVDVQPYDIFAHYPYYAFIWEKQPYSNLKITFFDRNDQPFFSDPLAKLETYWYDIEPSRIELAYTMLKDLCPSPEARDGIRGFMVPLYESEQLGDMLSVNAYLRNLHFWESLIDPYETTPSDLRMFWMTKNRYSEVKDMSEIRIIYNMLCHMHDDQIEPERILWLRDFFVSSAEERAEAIGKMQQLMGRSIAEVTQKEQLKNEERMREYDLRRNSLLSEFAKQADAMREVQARFHMLEDRKMLMMEEMKHIFARMLNESESENEALVHRMQEISGRQAQILEELKKHDIQ